MSRSLFIEEIEVPLGDQLIGITLQLNNLAELNDRQSNYSNTLKLIKTPELDQALGHLGQINEVNNKPYTLLSGRYRQNGIDIIPDGVVEVKSSGKEVQAILRSGNFEFFSKIKGLKIEDMDLSTMDHGRSIFVISGLLDATNGVVYPVIQYGAMGDALQLDLRYLHHAIYVHTLVDQIVSDQGFTKTGTIWDDVFYKSLVLPFSNQVLEGEKYDATRMEASNSVGLTATDPITVLWDVEDYNQGQYNPANGRYTFTENNKGKFTFEGEFSGAAIGDAEADIFLMSSIQGQLARTTQVMDPNPAIFTPLSISSEELDFVTGEYIWAIMDADGTAAFIAMNKGAKFSYEPVRDAQMNDTLVMKKNAPDISQTDLLKTLANQFGLFFQVQDKNLHAFKFDELLSNKPNARNWSAKLNMTKEAIVTTKMGRYAQINYIRYAEDDTTAEHGDSSFLVADETLNSDTTVITFKVAASLLASVLGGFSVGVIPRYTLDENDEFQKTESSKQRMLTVKLLSLNGGVILTDGVADQAYAGDLMLGAFEVPGATQDLMAEKLIANNYQGLVDSLDQLKLVRAEFVLNENDVKDFDFSTPVWVEQWGSYFYVNKITNFREGKMTSVQLVKL